jgi:hypothetical protein
MAWGIANAIDSALQYHPTGLYWFRHGRSLGYTNLARDAEPTALVSRGIINPNKGTCPADVPTGSPEI